MRYVTESDPSASLSRMESSQTPPPGGAPSTPPPAPPPVTASQVDDRAGAAARIGTAVLALALAFIAAVAVAVMVDVADKGTCDDIDISQAVVLTECYEFSGSVEPVVLLAGWIGVALTAVAALLALAFTIRGRGGRALLGTVAVAAAFLAISIVVAQLG